MESLAKRVEQYLSESTPGGDGACVARTAHQADSEERTSPTRVPKLKVNPAGNAQCALEIAVTTSTLVWWGLKDIFMETPSGGQPSGGAPPARQRRMPELAEREIQRKEAEDEKLEGEVVQDLNGDVHMKLSVPLVSRENRGPARVCNCTVFQQREGAIIQKMQVAGWL